MKKSIQADTITTLMQSQRNEGHYTEAELKKIGFKS